MTLEITGATPKTVQNALGKKRAVRIGTVYQEGYEPAPCYLRKTDKLHAVIGDFHRVELFADLHREIHTFRQIIRHGNSSLVVKSEFSAFVTIEVQP